MTQFIAKLADMPNEPTTRVREIRLKRGLNSAEAARLSGIQPSTFHKIDSGNRTVTAAMAGPIAAALMVAKQELYAPVGSPIPSPHEARVVKRSVPITAKRFEAAIWGWWGDNRARAAAELGLSTQELDAMSAGYLLVSETVLMRINTITGIPFWWFTEGRWTGIESRLAGRMGSWDPDLIEDYIQASDHHIVALRA